MKIFLSILNNILVNNIQEPMSVENFGKLYALLGLYLLKLKEKSLWIGFKQFQPGVLNPIPDIVYPPCDS